jgi:protein-S-isoprenylcysteine O-methyltransferase Ste14
MSTRRLAIRAAIAAVFGLALLCLLLFLPAGTLNYWQAWVFIAVFIVVTTGPNMYLALRRPDVLQRRLQVGPTAETRPAQKIASIGYSVLAVAAFVVSALDHRFGWSAVPTTVVVVGQVLVAIGLGIAMSVVLQNSYAASTIRVESDQQLVSTGLYGFVRHPMYFGVLIMMVGTPLALDSYWGLLVLVPGLLVFAIRILDEEKMLNQELAGYQEYTQDVRHRLVPYVW